MIADPLIDICAFAERAGNMSNRARRAAVKRIQTQIETYHADNDHQPTDEERTAAARRQTVAKIEHLRQRAADLRHYAACGMRPRKHREIATQLEAEADRLILPDTEEEDTHDGE